MKRFWEFWVVASIISLHILAVMYFICDDEIDIVENTTIEDFLNKHKIFQVSEKEKMDSLRFNLTNDEYVNSLREKSKKNLIAMGIDPDMTIEDLVDQDKFDDQKVETKLLSPSGKEHGAVYKTSFQFRFDGYGVRTSFMSTDKKFFSPLSAEFVGLLSIEVANIKKSPITWQELPEDRTEFSLLALASDQVTHITDILEPWQISILNDSRENVQQ